MPLMVLMPKPIEAEPTHISLLFGPPENSELNLQQDPGYCIGLYTFHLCASTPNFILFPDVLFVPIS